MSNDISIRELPGTWVVRAGGAVLGESRHALELSEGRLPPVVYFPRDDLAMAMLDPSPTRSTCHADRPSGWAPAAVAISASEKVAPQMIPAVRISRYGKSRCSVKPVARSRSWADYRDRQAPLTRFCSTSMRELVFGRDITI